MVILGKRARNLEAPTNPNHGQISENGETQKVSGYEQFREERIKENLERMQKLGILDLSLKLKSLKPSPKNTYSNRKTPQHLSPSPPSVSLRRSSRLQNGTPVSYSDSYLAKQSTSLDGEDGFPTVGGSKPEVYTEEHEKLLGSTDMSWTLFVDGYGKDGKRIYDQFKGKTCHQCRQKTLGHRTFCSKCNMVQGQFCGDCLYMRYGEHVLEAKRNPNWICPVCRGICNCSLCRQAKGWPPTGCLYRKVSKLGFKSVAHYLIQTRRGWTDSGQNPGANVPVSAKRSLPFSDMETMSEDNNADHELKREERVETHFLNSEHDDGKIGTENYPKPEKKPVLATGPGDDLLDLLKPEFKENEMDMEDMKLMSEDNETDDKFKNKEMEETHILNCEHDDGKFVPASRPKLTKKPALATELGDNHVGLLMPEFEDNGRNIDDMAVIYEGNETDADFKSKEKGEPHILINENDDGKIDLENSPDTKETHALATEPTDDHCGLLKPEFEDSKANDVHKGKKEEEMHFLGYEQSDKDVMLKSMTKSKKKPALIPEPIQDSIAGRLRQRRGGKRNGCDVDLIGMSEETSDIKKDVNTVSSDNKAKTSLNRLSSIGPVEDSINEALQVKEHESVVSSRHRAKTSMEHSVSIWPIEDSIAQRLKLRKRT